MQEFQERVVMEASELRARRERLSDFIQKNPTFLTLSGEEQDRMHRQNAAMGNLLKILDERIANF